MNALSASFPEYPRGSLQRRWWLLLERFLAVGKFVELGGFLTFLWDGKWVSLAAAVSGSNMLTCRFVSRYPNIMARILKMRLVPEEAMSEVTRVISYEFMNRQLVWTGFTVRPTQSIHGGSLQRLSLSRNSSSSFYRFSKHAKQS